MIRYKVLSDLLPVGTIFFAASAPNITKVHPILTIVAGLLIAGNVSAKSNHWRSVR